MMKFRIVLAKDVPVKHFGSKEEAEAEIQRLYPGACYDEGPDCFPGKEIFEIHVNHDGLVGWLVKSND